MPNHIIIWHHYWYNSMRAALENEVMLTWYALGFNIIIIIYLFVFVYSQKYLNCLEFVTYV